MEGLRRWVAALVFFALVAGVVLAVSGGTSPRAAGQAAGQSAQPASGSRPKPARSGDDQQKPDDAQKPVFRTGINFVRVDVIVSNKAGSTVGDLEQTDFEVTEDGKPQSIETFKLINLDGGHIEAISGPPKQIRNDYDEESEAARDDVRLFAVFLDDYHVRLGTSMAVREPLSRFVANQLGPTDMIGLMYPLEPVSQVRMTRNHDAVVKGIQQFVGRKFDYTPRNQFEEQYAYYPASTVEQIRNQVSLSAIKSLIVHMGSLKEGRKALIVVSEGFTNMLPPQLRDPVAAMPGLGNPTRGDPMAGANDPNEQRAQFFSSLDVQSDLREVYDTANRNNTAIYTVDPRGLAGSEFDIGENINFQTDREYLNSTMDTLRLLSDQSDGRAIVNRNDLEKGMKQIVRDSSAYYLIGYNSTQAPADGRFHEIKVKVKRPGVQVRARKGYWALSAEETARATAAPRPGLPKAVDAALSAVEQPTRARVVRTWIGTERGDNGKTKVTFVWEPVSKTAGERGSRDAVRGPAEVPLRVSLIAADLQSGTPYFRGRVPDVLVASAAGADGNGAAGTSGSARPTVPSRVTFEAPPGKMQLRVSVEGAGSQVLDSEVREMTVPDLTAHLALGTPKVFRARTAIEMRRLKADLDAVPGPGREFGRTDRLLIRVPAYGSGNTTPAVTARLLNRAGQAMTDMPVAPAAPASAVQQIDLPLSGLAAGEYILEVKAVAADGSETKELVGFRVTG